MANYDDIKDLYVVRVKRKDETNEYVYLFYETVYDQLTLKPRYVSQVCSHLTTATKFETIEEANEYVAKDCNYEIPTGKCEVIKISNILDEQTAQADDESNKVLAQAWTNTITPDKVKLIEAKLKEGGAESVVEFVDNIVKGFKLFIKEVKTKVKNDDVTE